jgi:hypothetical protein
MVCRILILTTFCFFGTSACANDIAIPKGNIELFEKYFQIDKSLIADSYISLSINTDALSEFEKKDCSVFAYIDYVLNNSTSFSVHFNDLDPDQLARQKINIGRVNGEAIIAVRLGNVRKSCKKDGDMAKEYGYYFDVAAILKIAR